MITFGIVMPTYRANDQTLEQLKKTIRTISRQEYPCWKLYLIGDRYEPAEELESAISIVPHDKLVCMNLPRAVERESLHGWSLWCCGGVTANNVALMLQERDGITHTCHLDHDDEWYPNHLATLADAYAKFPRAAFIYTRAQYEGAAHRILLPRENVKHVCHGNLRPRITNIVHATVSWRLDLLPSRYGAHRKTPADAFMWNRLMDHCTRKGLPFVYVPAVTVLKRSKEQDVLVQQYAAQAEKEGLFKEE